MMRNCLRKMVNTTASHFHKYVATIYIHDCGILLNIGITIYQKGITVPTTKATALFDAAFDFKVFSFKMGMFLFIDFDIF